MTLAIIDTLSGPEWFAMIASRRIDVSYPVLLARDPHCPAALLVEMASSDDNEVLDAVACNPNTPIEVIELLVRGGDYLRRRTIAKRPDLTDRLVRTLVLWAEPQAQVELAQNPHLSVTGSEILVQSRWLEPYILANPACDEQLLRQQYTLGRNYEAIAANPNCPHDLLDVFWTSSDPKIRAGLASNPSVGADWLNRLARDGHTEAVAGNPSTPAETLEQLCTLSNRVVANQILINPSCTARAFSMIVRDSTLCLASNVAAQPHCPPGLLVRLWSEGADSLHCEIVRNPSCPTALMRIASTDPQPLVRRMMCVNPNTPVALIITQPLMILVQAGSFITDRLPTIPRSVAETAAGLAGGWDGSLAELLEAANMIDA